MKRGLALVVCLSVAAYVLSVIHSRPVPVAIMTDSESMKARILGVGANQAYRELVHQEEGHSSTEQHSLGHTFGGALYETKGIAGFSVCDQNLLAGCFHEFIARAIVEHGLDVLPEFASQCEKSSWPTGCFHGMGHGLIGYFGYTATGLTKALTECSSHSESEPTQGCLGGAFMEMNLQTMSRKGPLVFDTHKARGVCDAVADQFRSSCFFWLPQWWRDSHFSKASLDELFKGLGGLCNQTARSSQERRGCFEGVGYIASPAVEFNREKTKALCDEVSLSAGDVQICWERASLSVKSS